MRKEKTIERLVCEFLNYHHWIWNLRRPDGTMEPVSENIPDRAVCKRCGAIYGIEYAAPTNKEEMKE